MVTSGRGEFFYVPLVAMQPGDRRLLGAFRNQIATAAADGLIRVVVDFAAFHVRRPFVQQSGQQTNKARFGLSAQTEQNKIMTGKNGVDDLRNDGIFISHDSRKQIFAALDATDQIAAKFILDRAAGNLRFGEGALTENAKAAGQFLSGSGQTNPLLSRL